MSELFELYTTDGLRLKGTIWLPDNQPESITCLVHGFGEHIGRYEHVAVAFNKVNMALTAIDLRGHGKSQGKRGHTPSYDHLLQDLRLFIKYISGRFPNIPIHLYGHSMGGNIVSNYLLIDRPTAVRSAVVTSAWFKLRFDPPQLKVAVGKAMRKIYPKYSESNGLNPDHLSTDKSVGKAYNNDPLVNDKITTEMYFAITEAGQWALDHATTVEIPLLVMHGSADSITSPEASARFADRASAQYKPWDGMYHETHNEIDKEKVIHTIIDWLKQHS
ncbi:Lysophospholipase [Fulvivirga imtechensis AK7]|uniref:Lysophospholipase n=1 Tax=Fulvivirga imtechensis AK7 TaxID=1237149 RepID=L8JMK7_9BACT|nr:alpha/beta hydrolase [Fulvivirga imtechensis]ELR69468.1 Lysophospholipase [Fulvivirga imtechensis AK7]